MSDAGTPSAIAHESPDAVSPRERSPLARPGVRRALVFGLIVIAAVALGWYVHYQTRGKYFQTTDDAYLQADSVIVAPKVAGYIERVFVSENQSIRQGQPLVLLDSRDYRAQASQATAQIEAAKATANTVRAQVSEQQAATERARAELARADGAESFAAQEVSRYEPLAMSGAEPRERLAQLRNQMSQAGAEVAARSGDVAAAERRFGTLQSQVDQARSQARSAEAQLAAANVNLQSTMVRASIDGRAGDLTVRVGQFVQPGTRMMTIVPVQQLYVEANFKETQVGLIRVGQPATIKVDALSDLKLKGHVVSFAPGTGSQFSILPPQNATGNFNKIVQRIPVRIAIDASPGVRQLLLPGMSVEVSVDTRSARNEMERIEAEQEGRR